MELNINEELKQIQNFPNYWISNQGRVWSDISQKWLKPTINKRGNHQREYVSLGRGNKFYVHQLVATAFVPNPNNYTEVDHIDANGLNNNANNLRWVTHDQNMKNEKTQDHIKKNTGMLIEIEDTQTGYKCYGRLQMAEKCGVSPCTISNHLNGKVKNPRWRATGNKIKPEE